MNMFFTRILLPGLLVLVAVLGLQAQQPDLVIKDFTVEQDSIKEGDFFDMSFTVENASEGYSESTSVGFYLSPDTVFSSGDFDIDSKSLPGLSPGAFDEPSLSSWMTGQAYKGDWYILAVVNPELATSEADLSNNTAFEPVYVKNADLPDILPSEVSAKDTVAAGKELTVNYSLKNQGSTNIFETTTGFYLSEDDRLDNQDAFITDTKAEYVGNGSQKNFTTTINIPAGITGEKYLMVVADDELDEFEEDEYNNATAFKLYVEEAAAPDLYVSEASLDADSANAGANISYTARIANKGTSAAGNTITTIYLSTDTVVDSGDDVLAKPEISELESDASTGIEGNVTIPSGTSKGMYKVLFQADAHDDETEENEDNNIRALDLKVNDAPKPDLVVEEASVGSDQVTAGEPLNVSYTVANQGTEQAQSSQLGFYLSQDNTWDEADTYVEATTVEQLQSGADASGSLQLDIPLGTSEGQWNVLFYADHDKQVEELNETNNVASAQVEVEPVPLPDLHIEDLSTDNSAVVAGETVSISYLVKNTGEEKAPASEVGYYVSDDTQLDAEDTYISSESVGELLATVGQKSVDANVEIPTGAEAGTRYLILRADDPLDIAESDEDNNTAYLQLDVETPDLPDLTVTDLSANPDPVQIGEQLSVSAVVKNIGEAESGGAALGFILSKDQQYVDTADYLIDQVNFNELEASTGQVSKSKDITIPSDLSEGEWYLLVFADNTRIVTESNETNNIATKKITLDPAPFPDLTIEDTAVDPDTLEAGKKTNASYLVENTGDLEAGASTTAFYLSRDTLLNPAEDAPLGTQDAGTLEAVVGLESNTKELTIPDTTTQGKWFVLYQADSQQAVDEYDETNNVSHAGIYVELPDLPDLTASSTFNPTELLPGEEISVGYTVTNQGELEAGESSLGYYISANREFEAFEDDLMTSFAIDSIASGANQADNGKFNLPDTLSPGTWYIATFADHQDAIFESEEANNIAFTAITIEEPPRPDLTADLSSLDPESVKAGNALTVNSVVKNTGDGPADASTLVYYLSRDGVINEDDAILGTASVPELVEKTGTKSQSTDVTIPYETETGDWNIIIAADGYEAIPETNETNNTSSMGFSVTPPPYPDVVASQGNLNPSEQTAGEDVNYSAVLKNSGDTTAHDVVLGLYLSSDENLDDEDTFLKSSTINQIDQGNSESETGKFTIPYETVGGDYHVLFVGDPDENITETDETNNLVTEAITVTDPPRPDLSLTQAMLFPEVADLNMLDNDLAVRYNISNNGQTEAASSDLLVVLSEDENLSDEDIVLKEVSIGRLSSGQSQGGSMKFTLDDSLQDTSWKLLFLADGYSEVAESNEQNNKKVKSLATENQQPDLQITHTSVLPAHIAGAKAFKASALVENRNMGYAGNNWLGVYLSDNQTMDSGDTFLGKQQISAIEGGRESNTKLQLAVEQQLKDGTYYLLFSADDSSQVSETVETNNTANTYFSMVQGILPDLALDGDVTLTADLLEPGDELEFSYTLTNNGNAAAQDVEVQHYLSDDASYDSGDEAIGSHTANTLAAGSQTQVSETYTPDQDFETGTWYLLVQVDASEQVSEANESNNSSSAMFEVEATETAIHTLPGDGKLSLYPNPASHQLHLQMQGDYSGAVNIAIYNSTGSLKTMQRVQKAPGKLSKTLDVADLAPGTYFIKLIRDQHVEVRKFIKR